MSAELTVALIASGASVAVAVVSLITSLINNRHSARSQKVLENLKFEFTQIQGKETAKDTHLIEVIKALQLAIQSIQVVKDELQLILSAVDSSLDTQSAITQVKAARERLFKSFEEQSALLDESEMAPFHQSKNISLRIENFLRRSLSNKPDASCLSEAEREHLLSLRGDLTEAQQLLRDIRTDRLLRRISNERTA
jgi:uncharacterized protein YjcR